MDTSGKEGLNGLRRTKLNLQEYIGKVVLPGDEFLMPAKTKSPLVLGPGLKFMKNVDTYQNEMIIACKAGVLSTKKPNVFLVLVKNRTYEKYKNDDVVAIVRQRGKGDFYPCEVAGRERAFLNRLGFEGASKRHRPDLKVGDAVYAKVVDIPKDFPMEITCINNSSTGRADRFKQLDGGHVFQVPVHFVRMLRTPVRNNNLLFKIEKIRIPFEIAVGSNGLVWIKTKHATSTLLMARLIFTLAKSNSDQYDDLINQFKRAVECMWH